MDTLQLRPSVWRASWAVAKREIRIFLRYPTWAISMLIWPALFPVAYIFTSRALAGRNGEGLASYAAHTGTTDYVSYILVGTFVWMWLNMMLWGFGTSLRTEQQRGTLESNWLSPVPRWFLLVGNALSDALNWAVYLAVGFLEFHFVFGFRVHGSPLLFLFILLISVPSVYGLGMVFASMVLWVKETNTAVNVVRGVMMVFCGMAYPTSVLPGWMQAVSAVLPLTHTIAAARAVSAGAGWDSVAGDLWFLAVAGALLLAAGFGTFVLAQRLVERQGSLGLY